MSKELIKYISTSLKESEIIIVYEDMVIYEKNDLTIKSKIDDKPQKSKRIEIKDKNLIDSMVMKKAYMPLKNEIIKKYNEVQDIGAKNLHRLKNTARKNIIIDDNELKISADMYIVEYGDVFEKLVNIVKGIIFGGINV